MARANPLASLDAATALRDWAVLHPDAAQRLVSEAANIADGNVPLFGVRHHVNWTQPEWHTDWKTGMRWNPSYFRNYSFYNNPKQADGADVKFPWELSRFGYFQPVAAVALLGEPNFWCEWLTHRLTDWESANPCAHSVNWYPMECSMRSVNLAIVAALLVSDSRIPDDFFIPLLRILTLQAEFVVRTIEYTEHRENHYAANLACLGLTGLLLESVHPAAKRWRNYAIGHLASEILGQFLPDGVNFEKSVPYHRLVTELFLLLAFAYDRTGNPLPEVATQRLRLACDYIRHYTHPHGRASLFGDNDCARAVTFDATTPEQHHPTLALATAFFGDSAYCTDESASSPVIPIFGGKCQKNSSGPIPQSKTFAHGGMLTARYHNHFLIADFGEVGLGGCGGHGHNDLFSYELSLGGQPLIVDSGCPAYTGDPITYNRYRGTAAHNGLQIDDVEIAPLLGYWRIAPVARPEGVAIRTEGATTEIEGQHAGYARLIDPVIHQRRLCLEGSAGRLDCADLLKCNGAHSVTRRLHFAPGLEVVLAEQKAEIFRQNKIIATAEWNKSTTALITGYMHSPHFGTQQPANCLTLQNNISGSIELTFSINYHA